MRPERGALERLADLAGIESVHRDFYGRETRVSDETKTALLRAMGFEVGTPEAIAAAGERLDAEPWQSVLEPVYVVAPEPSTLRIGFVLPHKEAAKPHHWSIVEESAKVHQGTISCDDLAPTQTREIDGVTFERRTLELKLALPLGYHRFAFDDAEATLIVAPTRAFLPPPIERGARLWGLAVQLYGLRSRRNWGIGDFEDLRRLAQIAGRAGAAAIGVNPLHALDSANPAEASPYAPSSRASLNALYLDVEAIAEFATCESARRLVASDSFARRLAELRATRLVDYARVAACKREVLALLYAAFLALDPAAPRVRAFRAFVERGGAGLERASLFEALRERFAREGALGWSHWPLAYRQLGSPEVAAFARAERERIEFFAYLQWNAEQQLAQAAEACAEMDVGLYRDLAIGGEADGADAWCERDVMRSEVTIGAPPDALNPGGQNWGLAPMAPLPLRARAYAPFVALLRANMRHAGALRIDHVMALQRLFWIPRGGGAAAGAYVRYPLSDLLAIVALESVRNRCLVVGEDLGTVPEGFRERLQWARIFSYRLLYFEREADGTYRRPEDYPPLSLVSPGTHDLPTLAAYWLGRDLDLRARLGLLPPDQTRQSARDERERERNRLLDALVAGGDLALEIAGRLRGGSSEGIRRADVDDVIAASYRMLARSPARLLMAPLEDVLGVVDQVNVPGTVAEHPNWRRRLPRALEDLARDVRFAAFAETMHRARGLSAPPTVPSATYRLQFHRGFTFVDAERLVGYLDELGISHVYASPFLAARSGSTHGYDIVDHNAINPEIGTRVEFERFVDTLHRHGMGLMLDFVPNHMGVGNENPWWSDVLEWGRQSPYAAFFDIDWNPPKRELRDKVLLPFLGSSFGTALERGEIALRFDPQAGTLGVWYEEHRFPLAPSTYGEIVSLAAALARRADDDPAAAEELERIAAAFAKENWRARASRRVAGLRARADDLKRRLANAALAPRALTALHAATHAFGGSADEPQSRDRLARLLRRQSYRPAFWRVALDEINYRRFFDINELAGLRVEYAECFAVVHQLVFRLIEEGRLQGLRIDHIDGLFDPKAYCTLLRARAVAMNHPLYLIVEKILARHENLRGDWLVAGTTGYEFANLLNGLFVDARNEARVDLMYRAFTGETLGFEDVLYACKRLIVDVNLASELNVLTGELDRIAQSDVRSSDYTRSGLRNALAEVVCAFPVYRTYVDGDGAGPEDRKYIDWAVAMAKQRSETPDRSVYDFVASILSTDAAREAHAGYRPRDVLHFAMKFQQYTAPVMAKALEDTSFYRYVRLVSLNEVGGDPRRFGVSPNVFHRAMKERAAKLPYALSSTSTHDTKRSEDVRVRIDALSELTG
ncbi:MAG: malto-oligosyltrehalose synthase, partial [Candidatus Baltobacteraceae bacterium]